MSTRVPLACSLCTLCSTNKAYSWRWWTGTQISSFFLKPIKCHQKEEKKSLQVSQKRKGKGVTCPEASLVWVLRRERKRLSVVWSMPGDISVLWALFFNATKYGLWPCHFPQAGHNGPAAVLKKDQRKWRPVVGWYLRGVSSRTMKDLLFFCQSDI